jgi:hypothetical protein
MLKVFDFPADDSGAGHAAKAKDVALSPAREESGLRVGETVLVDYTSKRAIRPNHEVAVEALAGLTESWCTKGDGKTQSGGKRLDLVKRWSNDLRVGVLNDSAVEAGEGQFREGTQTRTLSICDTHRSLHCADIGGDVPVHRYLGDGEAVSQL